MRRAPAAAPSGAPPPPPVAPHWKRRGIALASSGGEAPLAGAAAEHSNGAPAAGSAAEGEFNWRLGVVLGGCSFEAYNEPEANGGLCEATPSGSRILYVDK